MTEEVKKETPKTKLPGLPPLAAFIYAVLIFIMTMGYLKVFLIMGIARGNLELWLRFCWFTQQEQQDESSKSP